MFSGIVVAATAAEEEEVEEKEKEEDIDEMAGQWDHGLVGHGHITVKGADSI